MKRAEGGLGKCFFKHTLGCLQTTDYKLQTTDYKLLTTNYRLQTTNYKLHPDREKCSKSKIQISFKFNVGIHGLHRKSPKSFLLNPSTNLQFLRLEKSRAPQVFILCPIQDKLLIVVELLVKLREKDKSSHRQKQSGF